MTNLLGEIEALPEPLRHRAKYAVEASQAYGCTLESLDIRRSGGALHCLLHFDLGVIEFVVPVQVGSDSDRQPAS